MTGRKDTLLIHFLYHTITGGNLLYTISPLVVLEVRVLTLLWILFLFPTINKEVQLEACITILRAELET